MQSVLLPKAICDEIDKFCRGFIWGDSAERRKIHLISWDNVCSPKQCEGLGLRKAREMNLVSMMRASWRFCTQEDALWTSVMRKKYGCGNVVVPIINSSRAGSNFWCGLCKAWKPFMQNIVWRVGNGCLVKFWTDCWVPNSGHLVNLTLGPLSEHDLSQDRS